MSEDDQKAATALAIAKLYAMSRHEKRAYYLTYGNGRVWGIQVAGKCVWRSGDPIDDIPARIDYWAEVYNWPRITSDTEP